MRIVLDCNDRGRDPAGQAVVPVDGSAERYSVTDLRLPAVSPMPAAIRRSAERLFDGSDRHHAAAGRFIGDLREPRVTNLEVLAEACRVSRPSCTGTATRPLTAPIPRWSHRATGLAATTSLAWTANSRADAARCGVASSIGFRPAAADRGGRQGAP
jgi:hypothetical protein